MNQSIHLENLKKLGYKPAHLGPLMRLEQKAHRMAEEECNGEVEYSDSQWHKISKKVLSLFSADLKQYGFFINGDPRGYALKLDYKADPVIEYRDWGGYQILCPEFR